MTVEKRVQNGIEYLNENHKNWLDKINLDIFKMNRCAECILGQVLGDFELELPMADKSVEDLGFEIYDTTNIISDTIDAYNILQKEWTKQIKLLKNENR